MIVVLRISKYLIVTHPHLGAVVGFIISSMFGQTNTYRTGHQTCVHCSLSQRIIRLRWNVEA